VPANRINDGHEVSAMSDQIDDLSLVQIGLRVAFSCAVTVAVVVGGFLFIRFLSGIH
jgi:hypothetical protein